MTCKMMELPPLDLRAAVRSVDAAARTMELVFSTGADVARVDWQTGARYTERLSLDPKHVRLDRLNGGAPLLNSHSAFALKDLIGVVEPGSARVDGRQGRATVRFSRRDDVEPFYQDVKDGIIRNVSVGYRVHRFEETKASGGAPPVRVATDWEPFEISLVPMGADAGAGVRAAMIATNACVIDVCGDREAEDAERIARLERARAVARAVTW